MRNFRFLCWLFLTSGSLFAQDSIYKRNKEIIPAKVFEVGTEEIKFRRTDNPDGPVYRLLVSEVACIHYKGGIIDTFCIREKPIPPPVVVARLEPPSNSMRIEEDRGQFFVNNRRLGYNTVFSVMEARKDPKLNIQVAQARQYQTIYHVCAGFSFPCYIVGGMSGLIALMNQTLSGNSGSGQNGFQQGATTVAVVGILGGALLTYSYITCKQKYKLTLSKAVDRYNQAIL
jgi:hypothetical protein